MKRDERLSSPPWQPGTRLAAAVMLLLFLGFIAYQLRQLIVPLMMSLFLAYFLHPLVSRLSSGDRIPRWLAVLIVYLLLLVILIGATTGIGIAISQQVTGVIRDLRKLGTQIPAQLQALADTRLQIGPWILDLSQLNLDPIIEQLSSTLQPLLLGTGSLLASIAAATASLVGMVLMTMVLGFYMLLDFNKMEAFCLDLVPTPYREDFRDLLRRTGRVWQAFLRGQAILGLVIGVIVAGVLSIIGLRFALGLGLIAGLFEFVPIFGPFIAGMIAALVAVFQGSNWLAMTPLGYATLVVVIFVVVQQIENNILVPRIIGHSLNLNPFIVLLAIVGGGILAGVLGVLLAAPVVASLRIWLGYVYRKSVGLETLPTPVVEPLLPSEKPGRVVRLKRWWQNSVARTFERSSRNKNE